jgi:hypothetical protein
MRQILSLVFVAKILFVFGQGATSSLVLKSSNPKDFQVYPVGDSVLLTYRFGYDSLGHRQFYSLIVKPDFSTEELNLPSFVYNNIVRVQGDGNDLHVYYLVQNNGWTLLRKLIYDKATRTAKTSERYFRLDDSVIGLFHSKDFLILSQNKSRDSLEIVQLTNLEVANHHKVPIPAGFLEGDDDFPAFVSRSTRILQSHAYAKLKFYLENDQLVICHDRPNRRRVGFKGYTEVLTFALKDGNLRQFIIGESSTRIFRTFFYNGNIFKLVSGKVFDLTIFKNDSLVRKLSLHQNLPFMHEPAYYRAALKNVRKNGTAWKALSTPAMPIVTVHQSDSNQVFLKIGTHTRSQKTNYIPTVGVPLAFSITALVANLLIEDELSNSTDRYFYLKGAIKDGFKYNTGEGLVDHSIDNYELSEMFLQNTGNGYYKTYLKAKSFTYAFYRKHLSAKINVARF